MTIFKSKSNFMFGVVFMSAIVLTDIPFIIKLANSYNKNISLNIFLLVVPFIIAFVMFAQGMQQIKIDEKGIYLKLFGITLKYILWDNITEAGIGKIKINKEKYINQLYVSERRLPEEQQENLSKISFFDNTLWFDFSATAYSLITDKLNIDFYEQTENK